MFVAVDSLPGQRVRAGVFARTWSPALVLVLATVACAAEEDAVYEYEDRLSALDPMPEARFRATATTIDDGRVVILGGIRTSPSEEGIDSFVAEVELFDPETGALTRGASMGRPRNQHAATRVGDGRIVIVGGSSVVDIGLPGPTRDVEVYDPASDTFSFVGELPEVMVDPCATALPDGTALALDDCSPDGCAPVVVDPDSGVSTIPSYAPTHRYDIDVDCVTLQDGRVLLVGGEDELGEPVNQAEIFDPALGSFELVDGMVSTRDRTSELIAIADGSEVLIVGGAGEGQPVAEVYEVSSNSFRAVTGDVANRNRHTLTRLGDGRVLVAGGQTVIDGAIVYVTALDVFDPESGTIAALADELPGRWGMAAPEEASGPVVIVGGQDASGNLADVYLLR